MGIAGIDQDWLGRHVPNPCKPFAALTPQGAGRRWATQRQRRARILASARLLMTRQAFDAVHLQAIAAHCGVSVQTIYNIVGNRTELMTASASDWVVSIASVAREDAQARDRNACFTLLAMFWASATRHSDYVESAVRMSATDDAPLKRAFIQAGVVEFQADLERLRALGALRAHIDINSLARQLTIAAHATICQWKIEQYDAAIFQRELINGPALMLASALQGEELLRLERGIAEVALQR